MEHAEESKSLVPVTAGHLTNAIDRRFEWAADLAWHGLKHRPYLGVAITIGATLGAASLVGLPELLLAAGAGYAAYRVLKLNVPPSRAIRDVAKLEEGLI
jgi:hypothetical protein